MKRETTNIIRFFLEETLPPGVRDSSFMRWLFRLYWGELVDDIESFRSNAHRGTEDEYSDIYSRLPRIQEGTDNSQACIDRIILETGPGSVLDVGCGLGVLLQRIIDTKGTEQNTYAGVDFQVDQSTVDSLPLAEIQEAKIERLPFDDNSFDTVICTHVLEHILDIRTAVSELRRVCRGRLLIVTPKEREYRFTFNPHLNFFPYAHSFLKFMVPVPESAVCETIGRDFFYSEPVDTSSQA